MITPMDIHNREFKRGFRGYSEEDVDAFMTELASDYETVYKENREMKEQMEKLRERISQYEQTEATMNNALMLAQQTAENVKASARKEAELIIQGADQQKKNMMEDTLRSLQSAQEKYAIIRNDVAVFRAKMESILNSQLQMLDGVMLGECRIDSGFTTSLDSSSTPYNDELEKQTNHMYSAASEAAAVDAVQHTGEDEVDEKDDEVVVEEVNK